MKYPILCVCLLSASCVTSGDLLRVEDKVAAITEDGIVTVEEREELQEEIRAVAEEVEERGESMLGELAATGGLTGALSMIGLNLYRNGTRRKDLAQVKQV